MRTKGYETIEELNSRIVWLTNKVKEYEAIFENDMDEGWEQDYLDMYENELIDLNGGIR